MKKKTSLSVGLLGGLLVLLGSSCNSVTADPAAASSDKKVSDAGKSSAEKVSSPQKKALPAKAPAKQKVKKSSPSAGVVKYYRAAREKNKEKRALLFKEARTLLEKEIARKDNKNLHAWFLLGIMAEHGLAMKKDEFRAARYYRTAADRGSREAKLALAEFWTGRRMLLEDAYKMVISIPKYEKDPYALYLLGLIRYCQMRQKEGFTYFQKLLALPRVPRRYLLLVRKVIHSSYETYFKSRNHDGAMEELLRLRALDGKNPMVPLYMGVVEVRRGNTARAEELFQQSLAMNPTLPFAYRELAYLYAKGSRHEEALDNIKVAYAVSGKSDMVFSGLTEICLMIRDRRTLMRYLSSHKTGNKAYAGQMKRLLVILTLMERDYARAYALLETIMKDPAEAAARENQDNMALAASGVGKLSVAITMYEKLLKTSFQVVPGMNLAELYVVTDQYEKALKLLENKGFTDRADVTTRCIIPYLKVSALLALGKEKEALALVPVFEKALNVYRKAGKKDWDVHLFRNWLGKNKSLSEKACKEIIRMTDLIEGKGAVPSVPAEKAEKKSPVKK